MKKNIFFKSLTADYDVEEILIGEFADLQLENFLNSQQIDSQLKCHYCETTLLHLGEYVRNRTLTHDVIVRMKVCTECRTLFEYVYFYTKELSYLKQYMIKNDRHLISPQTYRPS